MKGQLDMSTAKVRKVTPGYRFVAEVVAAGGMTKARETYRWWRRRGLNPSVARYVTLAVTCIPFETERKQVAK